MDTQRDDFQVQIEQNLAALRTTRDEIRVQAHLFTMDLKRAWTDLEPQLERAEKAAKQATKASAAALHEAVHTAAEFRARMKRPATDR